jgi:hypothetical protein
MNVINLFLYTWDHCITYKQILVQYLLYAYVGLASTHIFMLSSYVGCPVYNNTGVNTSLSDFRELSLISQMDFNNLLHGI